MLRLLLFFNALGVFFVASMNIYNPGPAYPPTKGEVWPKPQQETKKQTYYKLSPSVFKFTEKGETCNILKKAIHRYTVVLRNTYQFIARHSKRVRTHMESRSVDTSLDFLGTLEELQIDLSRPCEAYPHLDMDEKYCLNVSAVSTLKSDSIWGILRGMETFAQLFYVTNGYKDVLINTTQILDFPRYTYRGLLIDTSRHYLTVSNILRTLDAMEMNKMNVLHWHIVDDESFPYQSEKFPQLSELGAYDDLKIYTKTNINQIVTYARDRGIRVLPEFDVPGHTRSWGFAYPGILTKCYQSGRIVVGPMNPTSNFTYKLIGDLFREVQEQFPDKYFHLGGDEVNMDCWASDPELLEFMNQHNMSQPSELHAYFMANVLPLLEQNSELQVNQSSRKPQVWQEVFDEGIKLPRDAIVQVWKTVGAEDMVRVLAAGYKVIYSSPWNLDDLLDHGDWSHFYKHDPRMLLGTDYFNLSDVLGGEAHMWGEYVNYANFLSRVWPRASDFAESLWSRLDPLYTINNGNEIAARIEEHTCRMTKRGVKVQPSVGAGICFRGI